MKLHSPNPALRFLAIIDDIDGDHVDVTFHATRTEAEAYVLAQYTGSDGVPYPDTTEPGGESYLDGTAERPNARVYVAELLARTVL